MCNITSSSGSSSSTLTSISNSNSMLPVIIIIPIVGGVLLFILIYCIVSKLVSRQNEQDLDHEKLSETAKRTLTTDQIVSTSNIIIQPNLAL